MKSLRVFISGTQDDLQPERQAVADAIHALGHEVVMAETYGAQPIPSANAILEMIEGSDIYLGVYGARYGWKMDGGISVTEFEFNEFHRKHASRILIYIKEIALETEQKQFLDRIQDFTQGYFRRPKFKDSSHLANWVIEDLPRLIERTQYDIPGIHEPSLGKIYLTQVAANKPYSIWTDATYIDRTVTAEDDDILLLRYATPYIPNPAERDAQLDKEPQSLEATLAHDRKLMLLGEPGIGKTTSLLHLAWDTATLALHGPDAKIPIYIELKYYNGEPELETLLARRVNEVLRTSNQMLDLDLNNSTQILKKWLTQSDASFLLLLDGLNEVRPELHTEIRGALLALLKSPHQIIISCRERDYDASLSDISVAFVLQGLDEDDIADYLERKLGEKGRDVVHTISWVNNKLMTLASNPLMLELISVVAQQDPEARLPKNRGKLLQRFIAMMPQIRRRDFPASVPLDVVQSVLARLGWEMQERGLLSTDLGEVRSWQIPVTGGYELDHVLAQAKDWRFLKSDGQMGDPVEFLHQLILEYFAAVQINSAVRKTQFENVLGERPFTGEWDEVLLMFAGIYENPNTFVEWFSRQIMEKNKGRTAFLVTECWETSEAISNVQTRTAVVDALSVALRDPDADIRRRAVNALARIGDVRAVEPLAPVLRDSDGWVRSETAQALGQIGDARAVEPLIMALRDSNPNVAYYAGQALERIKPHPVESLIAILREPDANVRRRAAEVLGKIGDARAVEPLIAALHDSDADVVRSGARALAELPDARAVEPLMMAFYNRELENAASYALLKIGSPAVESLIAALRASDRLVRTRAAEVLGAIGDARAVQSLIIALRDPDRFVSKAAIIALGRIGDASAIEPIIVALSVSDWFAEYEASKSLKQIGIPAIEPLISALGNPDAIVRKWAAYTLGEIGDASAMEPLIASLHDADADVRQRAVNALGQIRDARAVEPLLVALRDPNRSVRAYIASALINFRDARVVEPLIAALHDQDAQVREQAASTLGYIGNPNAVHPLIVSLHDAAEIVSASATRALKRMGSAAVEPIIAELRDPDARVRQRAAEVLEEIGDVRAVEPLIAVLQDPASTVRNIAARALGKIGDARAVEPLIAVLHDADSNVRMYTAEALGKIGDARAVEPLLVLLKDQREYVRGYAVEALARMGDARALPELGRTTREDGAKIYLYNEDYGEIIGELASRAAKAIRRRMKKAKL